MHRKRNDSVIADLFQGQFMSTVYCPQCESVCSSHGTVGCRVAIHSYLSYIDVRYI